jgi:hypothetical protein
MEILIVLLIHHAISVRKTCLTMKGGERMNGNQESTNQENGNKIDECPYCEKQRPDYVMCCENHTAVLRLERNLFPKKRIRLMSYDVYISRGKPTIHKEHKKKEFVLAAEDIKILKDIMEE